MKTQKHYIYITVEEFLQNGGPISMDRDIYQEDSSEDVPCESFNKIGLFNGEIENSIISENNDSIISIRNDYYTSSFAKCGVYVKIEVTPIYK